MKKKYCVFILALFLCGCASLDIVSFDSAPSAGLEDDEQRLWKRSQEED